MIRNIVIGCGFVAAIACILVIKTEPRHDDAIAGPSDPNVVAQYRSSCTGGATSADCTMLHAAVVAQTIEAIEDLADMHDPDAQRQARAALAIDEPQLQLVAANLLAASPTREDAVAAVSLLLGHHPALQKLGAELVSSAGTDLTYVSDRWRAGHAQVTTDPYAEMPAVPAIAAQFTAYPKATRYPPGDSSQSIGWATNDPLDKVVAAYAKSGKPLDGPAWKAAAATPLEAASKEMEALVQEFQKTHDMKLMKKIQDVQQRMADSMKNGTASKQTQQAPGGAPIGARKLPLGDAGKTFTAFAVEGDAAKPIRAVAIYRVEVIKLTVIEMIWDTSKYPAW